MTAPDLVFVGGRMFTAGQTESLPLAVAVRAGTIVAVADDAQIRSTVDTNTVVVELNGALLLPGFQDAHVHPVMGGVELLQCSLAESEDAAGCLARIDEYARQNPTVPWILGGGWSMDAFENGTPTRQALDAIVSDRPVFLSNRDHHGAWVNSKALELAGITRDTPDPADGRIERDASGEPSGTVHEGAMELVKVLAPPTSPDQAYQGLRRAQDELFALGITGWQDAFVSATEGAPDGIDLYLRAVEDGTLRARVTAALWWDRYAGEAQISQLVAQSERVASTTDPRRLTAGTVKIMVDGVAENFTAAMSEPYFDHHGHPSDNSGLLFLDPETLTRTTIALDALGFNLHYHALGDRAVREALDALEAARDANGRTGARHHLAHLQVIGDGEIPRFAELDATANIQALWATHEAQMDELTLPFLTTALADRQYPFGRLLLAGARLAGGSDWPVSSANPLLGIHVAVNRTIPGGSKAPLGSADQRLDLASALTAYTAGSAYVNGRETYTGRIQPGFAADLVVISPDPFAVPAEDIHTVSVDSTWIDGVAVYTAPEEDRALAVADLTAS